MMIDETTPVGFFCISDRGNIVEYIGGGNTVSTFNGRLVEIGPKGIVGPSIQIGEAVAIWGRELFSVLSNIQKDGE